MVFHHFLKKSGVWLLAGGRKKLVSLLEIRWLVMG
jgi:hypothetical protein